VHTDTLLIGSFPICRAYYYVDDVCLSTDSLQCLSVGIDELIGNNPINVFPNPTADLLHIQLDDVPAEEFSVSLLNAQGTIVQRSIHNGNSEIFLTIKDLTSGIYFL
ncbi:MAG: T9SS type A sorting domain-containing protein, partial [Chitinophagales bacterium]|nr:T9SS type A sorting domain-containing protein [Chitinophagales bacterium]